MFLGRAADFALSFPFLFSLSTAANAFYRDYAAIVFFANNRFETGKKKLQYLLFQDFAFCAGQLINNWTVGAVGERISFNFNDFLELSLVEVFAQIRLCDY